MDRQTALAGSTSKGAPQKRVGQLHLDTVTGKNREEFGVLLLPNRMVRVHVNCHVNRLAEEAARSGPPSTREGGAFSPITCIG